MVAAQLLWLYCNFVLQLLLPLAVGAIPGQDKSQVRHRWVEWDLLREQTLPQISQLPSWRYSGALCSCQLQEVGFLLCCVCNESKWKGTYWISSNSLYSPPGPQDNKHDFLSYWALPPLTFAIFLIIFILILSHMKDALREQWWGSASLFMTLWISVWVIGSESCSANYTRLMNCVITAAALHINWMHINDSSYSNLNDVWRSDVAHSTLIIFISSFGNPA